MPLHLENNPSLTVALALAAGMLGQVIARHVRVPGIVLLLVLGVLLGPDVANVVQPASLDAGLASLVGFAVAVILFEGGMSLNLRQLRRVQRPVQQLITVGAAVSMLTASILAGVVMGWGWQRALLFGAVLIVTGPTVVTPLVRRLSVRSNVALVLEAEGVLIDAVGAITAAVALELVLRPTGTSWALAAPSIAGRLGFGIAFGLIGGAILGLLLRFRRVIPEGLENTFTLGWAVLVFQLANALVHESGIAAVTVAGVVVGNVRTHVREELAEFKEQLTVMLIGMLFVLLVADVRYAEVEALGIPGLVVAAGVVVLVRPLSVMAGTFRTELTPKERVFIGWIGPRGIVAAAVTSFFGYRLAEAGIAGGPELRALVFLVIAVTVTWSALSGGLAARALGLRKRQDAGWVIIGGHALGRELARLLRAGGQDIVLVDRDESVASTAAAVGASAIVANALDPQALKKMRLGSRIGALALTPNDEVNFLFTQRARAETRNIRFGVALRRWSDILGPAVVHDLDSELLFGGQVDVRRWVARMDAGEAIVWWWRFDGTRKAPSILTREQADAPYVPLVHRYKGRVEPVTEAMRIRKGSEIAFLVALDAKEDAARPLGAAGWLRGSEVPIAPPAPREALSATAPSLLDEHSEDEDREQVDGESEHEDRDLAPDAQEPEDAP